MKKNDTSTMTLYLKEINKIPLLTKDQEGRVSRQAVAGDKEAQKKLVEANLRFVVTVAKRHQNKGLPLEDLINEGNMGLMKAISRFDPEKGYHFISYAVWWIRQAILKAVYEKSRLIRLPLNRVNELVQIEKTKKSLLTEYGEDPDASMLSRFTGIAEKDITSILDISRDWVSLESPRFNEQDSSTLGDFIEDQSQILPEELSMRSALNHDLETVLATLSTKEANILRHRFGLGNRRPLSLQEIGDSYGLTKERIRQIEKKALDRLRCPSRSQHLKDYLAA